MGNAYEKQTHYKHIFWCILKHVYFENNALIKTKHFMCVCVCLYSFMCVQIHMHAVYMYVKARG